MQLLLDAGADATVANQNGEAPIHVSYNVDMIKALISKTSIDVRDRDGKTVLLKALSDRDFRLSADRTPVEEFFLKIIELGADTSVVDHHGNSALHNLVSREGLGKP